MAKFRHRFRRYCSYICIGFIFALLLILIKNHQSLYLKGNGKITHSISNIFNFDNTREAECSVKEIKIRSTLNPFATIEVLGCESFLDRVRIFNEELDKLRLEALRSRGPDDWKPVAPHQEIKLIVTWRDDFLQLLGNFSQLLLVMLVWDKSAGIGRNYSSLND